MSDSPTYSREHVRYDMSVINGFLEAWPTMVHEDRVTTFKGLSRLEAEELFLNLPAHDQAELIHEIPSSVERRSWIRLLAPDDVADVIQQCSEPEERYQLISLLDDQTRKEVTALLAYAEDDAGGLMNSRFARLRPEMSVDEAIRYLRAQTRGQVETIYYTYVIDPEQKLQGVVSLRQLFLAAPEKCVRDVMETDLVLVPEDMDQEHVSALFSQHNLIALPVVDSERHMKGIVTIDDIVSVVQKEATEDIQKIGGTEVLDQPYLKTGWAEMLRKRGGWLLVLFVSEMLTASAMGYYEKQIERAVVLALFIPLIISSGGNSGSQACTLIIRALALKEVRLRDWWRVLVREAVTGLGLGLLLGLVGLLRILFWPSRDALYGEHFLLVGLTVSISLVAIVLWGTLAGSMLPFLLRRLGLDPASASAPFVATLVDVTGIIIYFTTGSLLLHGTLL